MTEYDVYAWNDIYQQLEKIVGAELTIQLFQEFRGMQINFPMKLLSSEFIGEVTFSEFNGKNLKELSRKFGYSERHLRRLIQAEKEKEH